MIVQLNYPALSVKKIGDLKHCERSNSVAYIWDLDEGLFVWKKGTEYVKVGHEIYPLTGSDLKTAKRKVFELIKL